MGRPDRAEVERRLVRLNRWSYLTLFIILFGWIPLIAFSDSHDWLGIAIGLPIYIGVLIIHCALSGKWWTNYEDIKGRL